MKLTVIKNFCRICFVLMMVGLLFTPQAAADITLNDANCPSQGDNGGTCFYDPDACSASGSTTSSTQSGGGAISGDLQSLAQQIVGNSNITFDYGPSGPTGTQFKRLANGQKAETDDGRQVDVEPIILVTILHIAQSHKINLSALTDGSSHTAPTNPHGAGKAVDINILDGSHTDGSDAVATKIIDSAAEVLPSGARFGMGNNPFGTKQINSKTFSSFVDNPSHVHVDVLGVSQADDDAAVQAAGAAGSGSGYGGTSGSSSSGCCPSGSGSGYGTTGSSSGHAITDGTLSAGNEYRFLTSTGPGAPNLSPITAAAITGNNIWESGGDQTTLTLNPSNVNNIGATGIAQWYQGRADALHTFAANQNPPKPWNDLGVQLDYLWHELQTNEKNALDATKAQTDIALATTTFEASFERSGDTGSYPARIALATKVLQKFGGGAGVVSSSSASCPTSTTSSSDISAYKNPLRDIQNLTSDRIDQGVDYEGSGPVYAMGDGKVINVSNGGWTGIGSTPTFIVYQLTDPAGPAYGKYVYFAEGCTPKVSIGNLVYAGDATHPSTVICNMLSGNNSIETGWANGDPSKLGEALAHDVWVGHDSTSYYTAYGKNYSQLLVKLGAPPGTIKSGAQELGSLPSGWPTW